MQVNETLKGTVDDTVQIQSDQSFWGIHLNKDWSYVIFGDHDGDFIKTGLCTRSGPVPPVPTEHQGEHDYAKHNMMMIELVLMENKPAPLKQLKQGVYHGDVICKSELVLIGKVDGTAACVKPDSVARLVERGWANPYYPQDGSIDSFVECVAAGNPVMESYPRQCRTADGKHFVEEIQ